MENRRDSGTTTTRGKLKVLTQELGREFIHWRWQINYLAKNRPWKERLHLRDNGKVTNLGMMPYYSVSLRRSISIHT